MKKLVVCMLTAGLLMLSSIASAGGYKNYGHGHKHHGHKHHSHKHHSHKHHGHYSHGYGHGNKHHGNRHHGYRHNDGHRSHRKHKRKSRHRTAYALGGLLLGSALTYGLTRQRHSQPRYNSRRYYQPHERHYGRYYSYPRY